MEQMFRFSHFILERSELDDAMAYGTPVTALCGRTWVPSRDPERFKLCPECSEKLLRGAWAA